MPLIDRLLQIMEWGRDNVGPATETIYNKEQPFYHDSNVYERNQKDGQKASSGVQLTFNHRVP